MPVPTIVFDLDGTLIDTAPDLVNACNRVLAGAGLDPVPGAELRPFISFGSRRMIEHGLSWHGVATADYDVDGMWRAFLAYYADNIAVDSRPYPGVLAAIAALEERGLRLAVCTNKLEGLSRRLLDALGLAHRFSAICGRDTFPVCKPHPDHLLRTIVEAGGDPAYAAMVGDSDTDVATAKAARIPIVGVSFGYTEIPMSELAPDALIDTYGELAGALGRLL